jgi:hypothetical protein
MKVHPDYIPKPDEVMQAGRYGHVVRQRVIPRNPRSEQQMRVRSALSGASQLWCQITEPERRAWLALAGELKGKHGFSPGLTASRLFVAVNTTLAAEGKPPVHSVPPLPCFAPSPIKEARIVLRQGKYRLLLDCPETPQHAVIIRATAPQSLGRSVPPRATQLGLMPAPEGGVVDLTDLYTSRFGPISPQRHIFLYTIQTENGFKDREQFWDVACCPN